MAKESGRAGLTASLRALAARHTHTLRDALVVIGILRAVWYFAVQGIRPWEFIGIDARAYWAVDLAHPYADSGVGVYSTYLYSPAFAQILAPFGALPFGVFFAVWTAASIAVLIWLVRPWPWALGILALPIIYELMVGQVHLFIAAAIVVGFRYPAAWVLPILTKITPGIGILWFPIRREWRSFGIAVGATLAVVAVSALLSPGAWADWFAFLTSSTDRGELLYPRIALGVVLVAFGALTDRRWLVPVAVWIALPVVWIESWVILLAIIRLRIPATAS
jgi:Glycosyltransferase family 87